MQVANIPRLVLPQRKVLPKRPVTAWCRRALHDWAYDAVERASFVDCPKATALLGVRNWLVIPRDDMYKLAQLELDYQVALSRGERPKLQTLGNRIGLPPGVVPIVVKPDEVKPKARSKSKSEDADFARMLAEAVTGQDDADSEEDFEEEAEG